VLARDRSAILITHRFSTVRTADRIATLQAGRISEIGSLEELLARDGRYAHLFRPRHRDTRTGPPLLQHRNAVP